MNTDIGMQTIQLMLEAGQPGLHRYRISIDPVENEISYDNNGRDIFVEVLDAREKILLLANSPHPDIAALKYGIESNYNYEVEVFMAGDFNGSSKDYDMLILHQLPSAKYNLNSLLSGADKSNLPVLYIVGPQTNIPLFNTLNTGVLINVQNNDMNEAQPLLNQDFALFRLSEAAGNMSTSMPPLNTPLVSIRSHSRPRCCSTRRSAL